VENGQQQSSADGPLKGFALFMAERREEWSTLEDEDAAQALRSYVSREGTVYIYSSR
jgi:hypothetical protein